MTSLYESRRKIWYTGIISVHTVTVNKMMKNSEENLFLTEPDLLILYVLIGII